MNKGKVAIIIGSVIFVILLIFLDLLLFGDKGEPITNIDLTNTGESTKIETTNITIDECSPNECLYILSDNVDKASTYKSIVTGEVKASISTQKVNNVKYKSNGNFLAETKSTSKLVNVGKQTFYRGDKIILRDATNVSKNKWGDSFISYTRDAYLSEYGVDQRELTNYILNDNTIISSELVGNTNGIYTFKFVLDNDKATERYKINMVKMGDLKSLPEFTLCELYVSMTANFEPVKIESKDYYQVYKFGFKVNCTSNLIETFGYFNDPTLTIPNEELFLNQIV